jgi:hypothetical protein
MAKRRSLTLKLTRTLLHAVTRLTMRQADFFRQLHASPSFRATHPGVEAPILRTGRASAYFLSGIVSSWSASSTTNTARIFAGFVWLALALTV